MLNIRIKPVIKLFRMFGNYSIWPLKNKLYTNEYKTD